MSYLKIRKIGNQTKNLENINIILFQQDYNFLYPPLCNCHWTGCEELSNWGVMAPFKVSVEGLVNETSWLFYVPHVL